MTALLLRKLATLGIVIAAALSSAPAAAVPVSLRAFAAQQMRLETIAYRMGVATTNLCSSHTMFTGMLLHDLSQYDPAVRPAVARAFSLGAGVGVIQIVPGSAAERAGVRIDDEIVGIGGQDIADPQAALQHNKSFARIQRVQGVLRAALQYGATELLIRRNGNLVRVTLAGDPGCGGELSLINSGQTNAWSDGTGVVVTTAIAALARNDDEIAFVIGHEMSHNIIGHARSSAPRLFGAGLGLSGERNEELAADELAVRLMQRGGYKPQGGIAFLQLLSRRFWWDISLDHPSFGRRIRGVGEAIAGLPADPGTRIARLAAASTLPSSGTAPQLVAVAAPAPRAAVDRMSQFDIAQVRCTRIAPGYFRPDQSRCEI
jgi:hypothetical protein